MSGLSNARRPCGREQLGVHMDGWNFADVWERNADRFPDATAQMQGDAHVHVAAVRPARRRHRGDAARCRARAAVEGRPLPVQLPRVPGEHVRHLQGRARPGEHQLPLHRRRARLPVEQRRRRGRDLPRHVHRPVRGDALAGAHREVLDLGRRRVGAVPGLGGRLRGRRDVRGLARRRAVGSLARRPVPAVHRRHDRHAEGRDVAPGRRVRQPRRARRGDRSRRRPGGTSSTRGCPSPARRTCRPRR